MTEVSKEARELLPCPYCGGARLEVASFRAGGLTWWQVECANEECGGRSGDCGSEDGAITKWNTRASSSAVRDALEPFATFATHNTDADGWAGNRSERERIVDWFGPSDFRDALDALATLTGSPE